LGLDSVLPAIFAELEQRAFKMDTNDVEGYSYGHKGHAVLDAAMELALYAMRALIRC